MKLSEHTFTTCNYEVSRYIANLKANLSRYIGFVNHKFYRNHAIVLLPRGDKWEVRTIYISPVCPAKVFSTDTEAFAYGMRQG